MDYFTPIKVGWIRPPNLLTSYDHFHGHPSSLKKSCNLIPPKKTTNSEVAEIIISISSTLEGRVFIFHFSQPQKCAEPKKKRILPPSKQQKKISGRWLVATGRCPRQGAFQWLLGGWRCHFFFGMEVLSLGVFGDFFRRASKMGLKSHHLDLDLL